jgi:hypothetical protein
MLIYWVKTYVTKKTTGLLDASKEVSTYVNAEKTECMLMSRRQNAGKNHRITADNRSFENEAKFIYLGTTVTIAIAFTRKLRAD